MLPKKQGDEDDASEISIRSADREGVAKPSAAAAQAKGSMDEYLRKRMLGLARGNSVQALDI
eukprot:COSAG06_NODE_2966_length_6018_cov_42.713127_6_plen_62_part_00